MKKTSLSLVISCLLAPSAHALDIDVTQMDFYPPGANGVPSFTDPLVTGNIDVSACTGQINSGTDFFYNPWVADPIVCFIGTGNFTWAFNSAQGTGTYSWSMSGGQFAIGFFFDWSVNLDIPVLAVFNTDGTPVDTDGDGSPGTPMLVGPFPGQTPAFTGTPNNFPPIAKDDNTGVTADTPTNINVIINDTDLEDGSPPPAPPAIVTPTTANSTQGFALTGNPDGTILYAPIGGYTGPDSFQYTLTDSDSNVSPAATVNITVTAAANTPPVTTDPTIPTNEDTPVDIPVASAGTDTDGPGPLTYSAFDALSAQGGAVTRDVTNTILTYAPAADFNGADTFTYTVNDGIDDSNVGTMTINVAAVNDAPVCTDVDLNTDPDTALSIDVSNDLLATCTDADGDPITLDSTTQPTQPGSTLADNGAGTLTYTPAAGFVGEDSFDFTATDSNGGFGTATANIAVGVLLGNFTMLDSGGNVFGGTNDVLFEWDGVTFNSQAVDAKGIITDTDFSIITINSKTPHPFFGFVWTAHNIRVFEGPATLKFDTTCTKANYDAGIVDCNNPLDAGQTEQYITMTLAAGQVGAHILFDWSSSSDIDVVNAWNQNAVWDTYGDAPPKNELWTGAAGTPPDPNGTWELVSTDVNGDSINSSPMLDGPFQGFYANFSDGPSGAAPPQEPYTGTAPDTKLGGGLFASPMNPWILVTVFMTLIGARRFRKKR